MDTVKQKFENPIIIQRPRGPRKRYYLEYEESGRPNLAYAFPCTKNGAVIIHKLTPKTLEIYNSISQDLDTYNFRGITSMYSGPAALTFLCTCGGIISSYTDSAVRCPKCNHVWDVKEVMEKANSAIPEGAAKYLQ